MYSPNSYYQNPAKSIFTVSQIEEFKKKAKTLNNQNEGDAACFYLFKS